MYIALPRLRAWKALLDLWWIKHMKKLRVTALTLSSLAALFACSEIPKEAYFHRGEPELLLESQEHLATFEIDSKDALKDILAWARKANPTEATLRCRPKSKLCGKLEKMLTKEGIAVGYTEGASRNEVTFAFERHSVRKCENRYIDNPINPYHLNHPTFGCTISTNIAQMVTDKRQFTDPALSDKTDARKAVQATDNYNSPSKQTTEFSPLSTAETLATSSGSGR